MNPGTISADGVADAFGMSRDFIFAFPALIDHGLLPAPVDKGPAPTIPSGWRFDLQQIATAVAADNGSVAKTAGYVRHSMLRGKGVPTSNPYGAW